MAARKVALVTGAGTGVGRAVTLALLKEGYAVVLAGRRKEPLEAVAKETTRVPLRRRRYPIFMSRSEARMDPSIAASLMLEGVRRFLYPWASSTKAVSRRILGIRFRPVKMRLQISRRAST